MALLLAAGMICLLLRSSLVMAAASDACRLFVSAVLPGLLPYMVFSQMLLSRISRLSPGLILLLGWGGGSPTGTRLVRMLPGLPQPVQKRLALSCATMSPMFLLGTLGEWLQSPVAGWILLLSALGGGWLTGMCTGGFTACAPWPAPVRPLSFGQAVEQSARTMLLICGTMVMLRVLAALASDMLPARAALPFTALLEVTAGAAAIAALPLPLPWRTAMLAGVCGFGGVAILLQNRAVAQEDALPLHQQLGWQALHGGLSFLLGLGMSWLLL